MEERGEYIFKEDRNDGQPAEVRHCLQRILRVDPIRWLVGKSDRERFDQSGECGGGGNCSEEGIDGSVAGPSDGWVPFEKVDREGGEVDVVVEETVGFSLGSRRDAGKVHEVDPREETGDLTEDFRWNAHHCNKSRWG